MITNEITEMNMSERFDKVKRKLLDTIYGSLNDAQRAAVFNTNGPLLVLAGAGSGKTTVIVNRIDYICSFGNLYADDAERVCTETEISALEEAFESGDILNMRSALKKYAVSPAYPSQILCITFTNKAAGEFKARLGKLLGDDAKSIWAGTFHSICVRILRKYLSRLDGYNDNFTIYDSSDSKKVVSDVIKKLDIDEKQFPVRTFLNYISNAKECCKSADDMDAEASGNNEKLFAKVYELYQNELKYASALDFDDLIYLTLQLFETNSDVLDYYRTKFRYVLVDEYQDTNTSQAKLVALLSSMYRNVCVVGDDDQSIYSFRGATVENILGFDTFYSDASVVKLEQNYRSTQTILDAANAVISKNVNRKPKTLWTAGEVGEKITVKKQYTQSEEAGYIVNYIREHVNSKGCSYSDFAVLYRLNAQADALEIIFSKSHIPYKVYGGMRFYDRKEIKDITAYLCVINNPYDATRLKRIINYPKRSIGTTTVSTLESIAEEEHIGMFDVISNADKYVALQKSAQKLAVFHAMTEDFRQAAKSLSVPDLIKYVIENTEYKQALEELCEDKDEFKEKSDMLDEMISGAMMYEEHSEEPSLRGYLEEVALVADTDNYGDSDCVTLMTVHSSKGLEFDTVFLPGFEDGVFPGLQTLSASDKQLEEERRLAYVAITRAKNKLIISHTNTRLLYGRTSSNQLSQFANDIPDELITVEQPMKTAYSTTSSESRRKYANSLDSFMRNTAAPKAEDSTVLDTVSVGDRISHVLFGKGVITAKVDLTSDIIYEVKFDNGSTKKLMASFAKLKKL